jgi:DNA modification methylase
VNEIIQGDCLEVMKQFPDKTFDCIITDPVWPNA